MSKFPIIKLTYQQGRFDTEAYRKKKIIRLVAKWNYPPVPTPSSASRWVVPL